MRFWFLFDCCWFAASSANREEEIERQMSRMRALKTLNAESRMKWFCELIMCQLYRMTFIVFARISEQQRSSHRRQPKEEKINKIFQVRKKTGGLSRVCVRENIWCFHERTTEKKPPKIVCERIWKKSILSGTWFALPAFSCCLVADGFFLSLLFFSLSFSVVCLFAANSLASMRTLKEKLQRENIKKK